MHKSGPFIIAGMLAAEFGGKLTQDLTKQAGGLIIERLGYPDHPTQQNFNFVALGRDVHQELALYNKLPVYLTILYPISPIFPGGFLCVNIPIVPLLCGSF